MQKFDSFFELGQKLKEDRPEPQYHLRDKTNVNSVIIECLKSGKPRTLDEIMQYAKAYGFEAQDTEVAVHFMRNNQVLVESVVEPITYHLAIPYSAISASFRRPVVLNKPSVYKDKDVSQKIAEEFVIHPTDSLDLGIYKVMQDCKGRTVKEISDILAEYNFNPTAVRARVVVLANKPNWFDRQKNNGSDVSYSLKKSFRVDMLKPKERTEMDDQVQKTVESIEDLKETVFYREQGAINPKETDAMQTNCEPKKEDVPVLVWPFVAPKTEQEDGASKTEAQAAPSKSESEKDTSLARATTVVEAIKIVMADGEYYTAKDVSLLVIAGGYNATDKTIRVTFYKLAMRGDVFDPDFKYCNQSGLGRTSMAYRILQNKDHTRKARKDAVPTDVGKEAEKPKGEQSEPVAKVAPSTDLFQCVTKIKGVDFTFQELVSLNSFYKQIKDLKVPAIARAQYTFKGVELSVEELCEIVLHLEPLFYLD